MAGLADPRPGGPGRGSPREVDAVLLLHYGAYPGPPDIAESVRAFERFSRFAVFPVDLYFGYPDGLDDVSFRAIVLHYTMFYTDFDPLSERVREYLSRNRGAYKVAFFQDEQAYLQDRIEFCDEYAIDCVYSCLESGDADRVYGQTAASQVVSYLPGYVGDRLRRAAAKLKRPQDGRPIDIGYRGRRAPAEWGPAVREKYEIAVEFERRAGGRGLVLDIETDEEKRIYGRAWLRFLSRCKAVLGTESGATIRDPLGERADISYRTISPRHFEAAALRSCQILFEGAYSGILEPMAHYIPLRKDFSNFDDVISDFRRPELRRELAENAYRDLIASEQYSYSALIHDFDRRLEPASLAPVGELSRRRIKAAIHPPAWRVKRELRRLRLAARLTRGAIAGRSD